MNPDLAYLRDADGGKLELVTVRDGDIRVFDVPREKALHWLAELAEWVRGKK